MKKRVYMSFVFSYSFALLFLLGTATGIMAQQYSQIYIWPPNVGVFASQGTQQFEAWGVVVGGSDLVEITQEVDWYLEENPFPAVGDYSPQDLKPSDIARIDENGKVTILSTWGRVNVACCYPKGCGDGNIMGTGARTGALRLLLSPDDRR